MLPSMEEVFGDFEFSPVTSLDKGKGVAVAAVKKPNSRGIPHPIFQRRGRPA